MANQFLTIDMITNELLRRLVNNLKFTLGVNRQYDSEFAQEGRKIGDSIRIRKPPRYEAVDGPDITGKINDYQDLQETLVLNQQKSVPVSWTAADQSLKIDDFGNRYLEGAAATLADTVDRSGMTAALAASLSVGTPGVIPSELLTYTTGLALARELGAPYDNQWMNCIGPMAEATIVDKLKTLFQASTRISEQYTSGLMGQAAGMDWAGTQSVATHTTGTFTTGSTPLVNGASQSGASLITDGWANSTPVFKENDVFTIDGVFAVNYFSYKPMHFLRQFRVTADVTSDGTGNATIPIDPPIQDTGLQRTVTALPADNAAINPFGAENTVSQQNIINHKDFITLGMAPLAALPGAENSTATDRQTNISVTVARQGNILTHQIVTRADVLFGWKTLYTDLGVRVWG